MFYPFSRSCSAMADQRLRPRHVPRNWVTVVALLGLYDLRGHLMGRGLILWLVGIPLPVILLLYLLGVL
jgi:hypothetical protein